MIEARPDAAGEIASSERRFLAMNTDVHVVIVASRQDDCDGALDLAERAVHDREVRWSRFLPESELSVLNRSAGRPVIVSDDTFALVQSAIEAWRLTGGVFDPTVGESLIAAGYDRSFELLAEAEPTPAVLHDPAVTPAGIEMHHTTNSVVMPEGVTIDLGGIAKGAACDAIVAEVLEAGASGCCVNIGGDLRVAGTAPDRRGWTVTLRCPGSDEVRPIALQEGAVCTSTTTKRRWRTSDGYEHHLRNPATGAPLDTGVVSATVIAARADQAEVLTKVAIAAGSGGAEAVFAAHGVTGLVVDENGAIRELPGFEGFKLQARASDTIQQQVT